MHRFKDQGETIYHFYYYRIVACPNCARPVDMANNRMVCWQCGFNKEFNTAAASYLNRKMAIMPLHNYLTIPCCGHTLSAINLEHLDFLQAYIEADIRERMPNRNTSILSRLPAWIRNYKNRDKLLRCIAKLRQKLQDNHYRRRN